MIHFGLRQTILAVILIATLLVALIGGILKMDVARNVAQTPHSTHALAWYCPAPPILC